MKFKRIIINLLFLFLLAASCSSCVTAAQVKAIIAKSNVATIDSLLTVDPSNGKEWIAAYNALEKQIIINRDQAYLVNQLRLRQAVLLTVNKKKALAAEKWSGIDPAHLASGRDKTLYSHRKFLVWWYARAGDPSGLDNGVEKFEPYLAALGKTINSNTVDPLLKKYFGILKAQVTYRRNSKLATNTPALKEKAKAMVQNDYNDLLAAFSAHEIELLNNNKINDFIAEAPGLAQVRYLFFLKEMAGKYKELPRRLGIDLDL